MMDANSPNTGPGGEFARTSERSANAPTDHIQSRQPEVDAERWVPPEELDDHLDRSDWALTPGGTIEEAVARQTSARKRADYAGRQSSRSLADEQELDFEREPPLQPTLVDDLYEMARDDFTREDIELIREGNSHLSNEQLKRVIEMHLEELDYGNTDLVRDRDDDLER